jgi:hypothetical protein
MSDERFYIRLRGRVQGPFEIEQLHSLARGGQFSRLHEVSNDGEAWTAAKDRPELFPRVAPARAPSVHGKGNESAGDVFALAPAQDQTLAPSDGEAQWYYARGGVQEGPADFARLVQLAKAGQLSENDLVWSPSMSDWTPARQVQGLISVPARNGNVVAASSAPSAPTAAPAVGAQTPGLAVASLVLGLLCIAVAMAAVTLGVIKLSPAIMISCTLASAVSSLLAVVFGHSASQQAKQRPDLYSGSGMAVAGMVCGYIVLAIGAAIVLFFAAISLLVLLGVYHMTS